MSADEPTGRILEPEALVRAVAAVLLWASAEAPGERVHVQGELRRRGIVADAIDVHNAVAKLRRRYGWLVVASAREAGYQLRRWPFRFTRRRGPLQLSLFNAKGKS